MVARGELRQRDGSIDVVEGRRAVRVPQSPLGHGDAVGDERADDDAIRLAHRSGVTAQAGELLVEGDPAEVGPGKIAVFAIPRAVALEKENVVTARGERRDEAAVRRGVAVSPRGSQG